MRTGLVAVALLLAACSVPASPRAPTGAARTSEAATCPATVADPRITPPPAITDRATSWRGNDVLWIVLPPDGIARGNGMKIPAYRLVSGPIEMRGRRIDGPAPEMRWTPPSGYGDSGFQVTGPTFPVAGCWEVTYALAGKELRFVLDVGMPSREAGLPFTDGEADFIVGLSNKGVAIRDVKLDQKLRHALPSRDGRLIETKDGWVAVAFFNDRATVRVCEIGPGYEYRLARGAAQGYFGATAPLHFFANQEMLVVTANEEFRLPIWETLGRPDQVEC